MAGNRVEAATTVTQFSFKTRGPSQTMVKIISEFFEESYLNSKCLGTKVGFQERTGEGFISSCSFIDNRATEWKVVRVILRNNERKRF